MAIIVKDTPKGKTLVLKGRALWAKLIEPDTHFKQEGEYTAKVILAPEDVQELQSILEEAQEQAVKMALDEAKAKKKVLKPENVSRVQLPLSELADRETGEGTGEWAASCKCKASGTSKDGQPWKKKVPLFSASGKPIKSTDGLVIWNGSIIKVNVVVNPFATPIGAGVQLRLVGAQIIELAQGGADASSLGFDAEDGWEPCADPSTDPFPPEGADATAEADF